MTEIVVERRPRAGSEGPTRVDFYFDPVCPWAWRASQWMREVRRRQPLDLRWKLFSLALANDVERFLLPMRVLAVVDRRDGNEVLGRLYHALGTAIHERGADAREPGALERAVEQGLTMTGLDLDVVDQALSDESTVTYLQEGNRLASEGFGTYGVPWLVVDNNRFGFNGPVIDTVPRGDLALQLWEHLCWLLSQPYFYELKRERNLPVPAVPVSPARST